MTSKTVVEKHPLDIYCDLAKANLHGKLSRWWHSYPKIKLHGRRGKPYPFQWLFSHALVFPLWFSWMLVYLVLYLSAVVVMLPLLRLVWHLCLTNTGLERDLLSGKYKDLAREEGESVNTAGNHKTG